MRHYSTTPRLRLNNVNWSGVWLYFLLTLMLLGLILSFQRSQQVQQPVPVNTISMIEFEGRITGYDDIFVKNVPDIARDATKTSPPPETLGLNEIRQLSFPKQV
jgi:hypothetical protein